VKRARGGHRAAPVATRTRTLQRIGIAAACVGAGLLVAGPLGLLGGDDPNTYTAEAPAQPQSGTPDPESTSPSQSASPTQSGPGAAGASAAAPAGCKTPQGAFVPTAVSIPGVVSTATVLALPRTAAGVPGVPPLTGAGKAGMAFDLGSGIRPGDPRGNALLNAHTYGDGSALGDRLLAKLHEGGKIVVQGAGQSVCYRVTERVEVAASDHGTGYYDTAGRPQVAIVVCSGKRIGAGKWTKRTLWFASPMV
jgi:hypothetical protein